MIQFDSRLKIFFQPAVTFLSKPIRFKRWSLHCIKSVEKIKMSCFSSFSYWCKQRDFYWVVSDLQHSNY